MRKLIHFMLMMIFVGSCFVFYKPSSVSACSCAGPESVENALKSKTAIFSGKVIKMEDKKSWSSTQSSADPITVWFEVKSSWKGIKQSQVKVTTARDSASCGLNFTAGNEYLVYAYGSDDQLETGLCERTTLLQNAHEDLQVLGVGKVPTEKVDLESSENSNLGWIIGGGLFLILILTFPFLKRYRKKFLK